MLWLLRCYLWLLPVERLSVVPFPTNRGVLQAFSLPLYHLPNQHNHHHHQNPKKPPRLLQPNAPKVTIYPSLSQLYPPTYQKNPLTHRLHHPPMSSPSHTPMLGNTETCRDQGGNGDGDGMEGGNEASSTQASCTLFITDCARCAWVLMLLVHIVAARHIPPPPLLRERETRNYQKQKKKI